MRGGPINIPPPKSTSLVKFSPLPTWLGSQVQQMSFLLVSRGSRVDFKKWRSLHQHDFPPFFIIKKKKEKKKTWFQSGRIWECGTRVVPAKRKQGCKSTSWGQKWGSRAAPPIKKHWGCCCTRCSHCRDTGLHWKTLTLVCSLLSNETMTLNGDWY